MPGEHGGADAVTLGGVDEEVEGQTGGGVLVPCHQGQVEAKQRVEQPVLGGLDLAPARQIPGKGQVRHHPVVPTASTVPVWTVIGQQPIAGAELGICTEAVLPARIGIGVPDRPGGLQGGNLVGAADIAEPPLTALAFRTLETRRLVASLALKDLHGPAGPALWAPAYA